MRIECRLEVRVTELYKKKSKPFTILIYHADSYSDQKLFKLEYRIIIIWVSVYQHEEGTNWEDRDILKASDWFVKDGVDRTRFINYADTSFVYYEETDKIYIDRHFDVV